MWRAWCTTWLLVSSSPSGVKKNPEPLPRRSRWPFLCTTSRCTTAGAAGAAGELKAWGKRGGGISSAAGENGNKESHLGGIVGGPGGFKRAPGGELAPTPLGVIG